MADTDAFIAGSRYFRTVGDWACTQGNILRAFGEDDYSLANPVDDVPADAIAVELRGTANFVAVGDGNVRSLGISAFQIPVGDTATDAVTMDWKEPPNLVAGTVFARIGFKLICAVVSNAPVTVHLGISFPGVGDTHQGFIDEIAVGGFWLP